MKKLDNANQQISNMGICRECFEKVPMNEKTKIDKDIWECPFCDYPNHIEDFHEIYKLEEKTE